jgi:hypothetical protein
MDVLTDPHRRSLLDHFSAVPDPRQAWRVAHPLPEVLLLVVCGTIAANDDYDDIVDWGEAHLSFLRRFSAFHFGLPCADWLRTLMNRIDPDLFSACFLSWVREWWPEVPDLIALDGKTSRRSYDRKAGRKALHLVSAFATNERLVLGQEACAEKSNEITAIPALLARLAAGGHLKGALVSIDAVACNPEIAQAVVAGRRGRPSWMAGPNTSWPSRRTSRLCMMRSSPSLTPPKPRTSRPWWRSTRITAASRPAGVLSHARSTGSPASAGFRASPASPS